MKKLILILLCFPTICFGQNNPSNADDFFKLADTYFEHFDVENAILHYSDGLILENNQNALANRGLCYYAIKNYDLAIIDFTKYLDDFGSRLLYQEKLKALDLRSNCYFVISKFHSAISDLTEYEKIYFFSVPFKSSDGTLIPGILDKLAEKIYLRGVSYALLNSATLACRDFKTACDLGYDKVGSSGGSLSSVSATKLGAVTVKGAIEKACKISIDRDGVCFPREINRPTSQPITTRTNKIVLPIINEGDMKFIIITIGNRKYKYLVDTGASDMIINSDIEKYLISSGHLRSTDYRKPRIYEIANGQQIKLKIANLSYIKIDNNKFNDIEIAVGDQHSSLLLGMSFLNRFDWKFTRNTLELSPKY